MVKAHSRPRCVVLNLFSVTTGVKNMSGLAGDAAMMFGMQCAKAVAGVRWRCGEFEPTRVRFDVTMIKVQKAAVGAIIESAECTVWVLDGTDCVSVRMSK